MFFISEKQNTKKCEKMFYCYILFAWKMEMVATTVVTVVV